MLAITADRVREIFKELESGDRSTFFKHVAEDVDWSVMGTHPLAGHYFSQKAFVEGTFAKLAKVLPEGAELHTEHVIVQGDQAVVDLHSLAIAKNDMRFDNRYCWVVYFRDRVIVRVRAYLDSASPRQICSESVTSPSPEFFNEDRHSGNDPAAPSFRYANLAQLLLRCAWVRDCADRLEYSRT